MSNGRESIFFNPQGPLGLSYLNNKNKVKNPNPIIGWYFVSIQPPKRTFLSSISGMFSKPEPYYLFEKDTDHEEFRQAASQRVEIPVSKIVLDEIIPDEKDRLKIQTGGKRSHRTSKRSKKSKKSKKAKKSRKVRHH